MVSSHFGEFQCPSDYLPLILGPLFQAMTYVVDPRVSGPSGASTSAVGRGPRGGKIWVCRARNGSKMMIDEQISGLGHLCSGPPAHVLFFAVEH